MRRFEPVAGIGGILLLVSLFLQWYGVSVDSQPDNGLEISVVSDEENVSAWAAFAVIDVLLALIAIIAIAVPLVSAFTRGPAKSIGIAVIASTLTPFALLLVVFRIIFPPGQESIAIDGFRAEIVLNPALGAWLSLAGALIALVGAWLSMRDESTPGAAPPDVPRRPVPNITH